MTFNLLLKIISIIIGLYIFYKIFYIWGHKPIIFTNKTFDELIFYLSILLYRGYTEVKEYPDGRLFIYSTSNSRQIMFKKYLYRGKTPGIYIFVPIYDESIKKITDYIDSLEERKLYWTEMRQDVNLPVLGIDIEQDLDWGIDFFKNCLIKKVFQDDYENFKFNLYFKNVHMVPYEFIDFDYDQIEKSQFAGNINIPVNRAGRLIKKLSFLKKDNDYV